MDNYFIVAKGIIQSRADEAECYGKNKIEEWAKTNIKQLVMMFEQWPLSSQF